MSPGEIGRSLGRISLWASDKELIRWGVGTGYVSAWLEECVDDSYFSGALGLARLEALLELEPQQREKLIDLLPTPIAYRARQACRVHLR
jgi:hypothetical protein